MFSTVKKFSTEAIVENGFLVENFFNRGKCLLLISRGGAQVIFLLKRV